MKLEKISEKEFEKFADKHEQATFFQTSNWGKLKAENGWGYDYLGFKENGKIIAATLMLNKNTPIKKKMFYAPRGFLIDYNDDKLLENFTKEIKKYVKENKGFFFKIDPYVLSVQRDKDGLIVKDGFDNRKVIKKLKSIGYKQQNSKITEQTMQCTWMYTINLENRSLEEVEKDMDSKTRQMIRKNEKNGVIVREGTKDDIELFTEIMNHTSARREFLPRSYTYYLNMYEKFIEDKKISLKIAELHPKEQIKLFKDSIKELNNELEQKEKDYNSGKLKKEKYDQRVKDINDQIERTNKSINELKELDKEHGDIIPLGGILFFLHGSEVLSLYGGAYQEFLQYQSFYSLHYDMIKYGLEHGYKKYNFYGISGNLTKEDPMYGIYLFKKSFGGQVEELVGEYDYVINKTAYLLYKAAYKTTHSLKSLKQKIKK